MIRKSLFTISLVALASQLFGQSYSLSGRLYDDEVQPLASGTVVLLNPADSTLEFFGVTNAQGQFEIRNIKAGKYLLQASFIGFRTLYSPMDMPRTEGPDLGDIVLQPMPVSLTGAEVIGEAVPLQISGDTIVYNAAAFKTKPDAVTEDLLKKLPGIEVDRAGNIKALGEDVNQLYVDGKEFFGNDPTVATRNIPADAINKVQVYDKKSDETEFTGIDDGTRNKTVNLELKEESKKGVFGDLLGGYGTGNHYKGSAKAYRFTDKVQIAGLGMINNINQYGFSFSDFLDFQGGISAMMGGGGSAQIKIRADDNFPINFGQPVDGLTTSGAGGLNFSYSTDKHNRTYISYLINGSEKDLERYTQTEHFLDEGSYSTTDDLDDLSNNMAHRINFGLRRRVDSIHNLILSGDVALMYNQQNRYMETENIQGEQLVSRLLSDRTEDSDRMSGNLVGTYYRMLGSEKSVFKITGSGGYMKSLNDISINNVAEYLATPGENNYNQFQNNHTDQLNLSLAASYTQKIGKGLYLVPMLKVGASREHLDRLQGSLDNGMVPVDSISPDFDKDYNWMRPGFNFQWNTEKSQLTLGFVTELGRMETSLNEIGYPRSDYFYFTPTASWDYSRKTGRKVNIFYSSSVSTPSVNQLLPVVNNLNPLSIYYGNPALKPEFNHRAMVHWLIFDQFSFTSLMMAFSGGYTSEKINWSTTVTDSLVQISTLTNVDRDFRARANIDFSTPIRKLGIKINFDAEENWNRGMSIINNVDNTYHSLSQRYSLSADNRKKNKWDVESGVGATLTSTWYDIQESLNSRYFDLSWFGDIRYNPTEKWNIQITGDVTSYADLGFDESVLIPLLRAEVSYYFLAHNRGVLTLSGHDLLDRNQIVQRMSELNYLRETRSNTIGRYVMLTFKYRLNKIAREGGLEVDFHKRR